ncbi:hypothetical protein ACE106_09935 [Shouchella clausii]|uniref:hypothetical protein n=1 Tax=Shouchella clausii TaxID=79880 RepID=UPI00289B8BA1|nr:hypothetical protein [Shouchella clausii]
MKKTIAVAALALVAVLAAESSAQANSPIVPGYEVKFNLDIDQFENEDEIVSAFHAVHDEDVNVYYFDTPEQQFRENGYIHRLRVYGSDKKNDLTYKKVFPDMTVDEAINEATLRGFHGDMSNYKFENDRKQGKDTFSISRKEKFKKTDDIHFEGIDEQSVIALFRKEAPKKYAGWDDTSWYDATLSRSISYGPALAKTYEGEYLGIDADLEIWSYQGELLAELSTKTPDPAEADAIEAAWLYGLTESGWLSADQTSKTSFVMDR